ncbi:exostosin-2 isoform X2 [Aethina tumida]|uniref:exostosin-2 isoform X2 n=1 Tax=Aethina tumida TaxID=116153 RepID=UPI00214973FC|nr:exostosin-2 isoform X2 [Aethina tumida]
MCAKMTIPTRITISKVYSNSNSHKQCKNYFFFLLFVILIVCVFIAISLPLSLSGDGSNRYEKIILTNVYNLPEIRITKGVTATQTRNALCTHWDCFNIYKCGHTGHDRISVYVYPLMKFVDDNGVPATEHMSKEYHALLQAVINSKYYTANPQEACIFIPSIDTLNQDRLRLNLTSKALTSLSHWNGGENHLIFNMISGTSPDFSPVIELDIGKALLAGAGFDTYTFREGFDISIPLYSPVAKYGEVENSNNKRTWLITSSQINISPHYIDELQRLTYLHHDTILILDSCHNQNYSQRCDIVSDQKYSYPQVLGDSVFCLVFRGERLSQFVLVEALAANCIPIFVIDGAVLPFKNVIDWKHSAIFIMEDYLSSVVDVVSRMSSKRIAELQNSVRFIYKKYFSSMEKIVITTLDIIQDRIYPHWSKVYDQSNLDNSNPLFFPITAPKSHGFTAIILTYDRVESLFILIERLSKVPSLMKVIVVWNNQKKSPPPLSDFPTILKPIKVIKTKANKLSNRFYPFKEIETEAVLHIDDDIVMLTSDEVEFAYEVWREFPDRIVGFPSRWHRWDNVTGSWKYESEWTNEVSMVLTGAAFLHKYWSYLYTKEMPTDIKDWVDDHMNCEDIAMNFLVANVTNKPPIKVTPRKKFKCPECVNNEMLSADLGHMVERSQCINKFAKDFGRMPLKSVEFRADPVLFKDPFPEKLKRFNDIGSL